MRFHAESFVFLKGGIMNNRLSVNLNGRKSYDIVIASSYDGLKEELLNIGCSGKKICIVTDDYVSGFYLESVYGIVTEIASETAVYAFHAGEASKTLDTVSSLYEVLIRHEFDRKDFLLALGGGVTGDLCGFAAATYLRGISFIQVPTSLIAQVDSSIGGKTGVDFGSYKNMVGAFHMPSLVYTDISALGTLPDREFSSGMGEVIKHGLIMDASYFEMLWDNREKILHRDPEACREVVYGSNLIKQKVVEKDPLESGYRAILNFGHTIGHAVEKDSGFSLSHGASVGLGMICACAISKERGLIPEEVFSRVVEMLSFYGLPVKYRIKDREKLISDTRKDKKMESGHIRFILIDKTGNAYIDKTVSETEMQNSLEYIDEK